MNVLVTHECSSVVAAAFRRRGHNAWSNDIKPTLAANWRYHLEMDYRKALEVEQWDLLIAHPVCTYLCNSGVSRLKRTPPHPAPGVLYGPARWTAMQAAAIEFRDLLRYSKIKRKCLENPVMHGFARAVIGRRPTQTVQPYQFGDDASKRTGFWLEELEPLEIPDKAYWAPPRMVCSACGSVTRPPLYLSGDDSKCFPACTRRPRWANQTDGGQNKLTPSIHRGAERAATYAGIAAAMAGRWG